jgi:hypothetical protein
LSAPSVVIVWVLAAELASPATAAMQASATEALGNATEVRIVDEQPTAAGAPLDGAAGLVKVTWIGDAHERAHLSCYLPRVGRWVEREVPFDASDPEHERGRALGYLLASILVEQGALRTAAPPAVLPRTLRGEAARSPAVGPVLGSSVSFGSVSFGAEGSGPGPSTGFGGYLGAGVSILDGVAFGGSVRARFGEVPEAQATTRYLAAGPELTWNWLPRSSPWALGLRSGAFVSYLAISHLSDDDVTADKKGRWLVASELLLHAGFRAAPKGGVFADAGVVALSGRTELDVRHEVVAVWPLASPLLRLGVEMLY